MAKGNIFISYRRGLDSNAAGRLYDRLERHFDRANLYFDIDSIPLGVDFRQHIDAEVGKCDAQLVVIGPGWVRQIDRLQNPDDFVRIEIEAALNRADIPVIPVLFEGTGMPALEQLPESLQALVGRNAIRLPHTQFSQIVDGRLVPALRHAVSVERRPTSEVDEVAPVPEGPEDIGHETTPQVPSRTGPGAGGTPSGRQAHQTSSETGAARENSPVRRKRGRNIGFALLAVVPVVLFLLWQFLPRTDAPTAEEAAMDANQVAMERMQEEIHRLEAVQASEGKSGETQMQIEELQRELDTLREASGEAVDAVTRGFAFVGEGVCEIETRTLEPSHPASKGLAIDYGACFERCRTDEACTGVSVGEPGPWTCHLYYGEIVGSETWPENNMECFMRR